MKKMNGEVKGTKKAAIRCLAVFVSAILAVTLLSVGCCQVSATSGEKTIQNCRVSVAEVKDNYPAIYTLISDDGYYDSGMILNTLAQKLNMHVTVAGFSRKITEDLEAWKEIESQGYVEVISHSYSHKKMSEDNTVTDDELYREIYTSRVFTENTFGKPIIGFVCPNNEMTERGYAFLNEAGYFAVRRGTRGENPINPEEGNEPFQWFNLGCRGIGDVQSTAERNAWLDSAINNGTWLIEMWHNISPAGDSGYQPISTAMAQEHLEYVAYQRSQGNVWIASYQDAVRYLREKQNAQVQIVETDEKEVVLNLTCDRDKLPLETFHDPLTLNVQIPRNWNYVFVFQNGSACEVTQLDDSTVSFNAVPDGGEITIRGLE